MRLQCKIRAIFAQAGQGSFTGEDDLLPGPQNLRSVAVLGVKINRWLSSPLFQAARHLFVTGTCDNRLFFLILIVDICHRGDKYKL